MARKVIHPPVTESLDHKSKKDFLMWQGYTEGDGIAEAALHAKGYTDIINIQQGNSTILLNYESVDEFIKVLKTIKKNKSL